MRISGIEDDYYFWAQFEKDRAKGTLAKCRDCIGLFKRHFGDINIKRIKLKHFEEIKKIYFGRNCSRARVASILYTMKAFLKYCRDERKYKVLDAGKIKVPTPDKNHFIEILTESEIARIKENIETKIKKKNVNIQGLRWKCLIEVLRSSGMRITEALSLNRDSIDFLNQEAVVCGKGGKYRTVFFSDEAVELIKEYLTARPDDCEALFVSHCGQFEARRWSIDGAQNWIERWRKNLGISKNITFHIFRRTFASRIFAESDIFITAQLLGHSDIRTTKNHYVSIDWNKLREIHHRAVDKVGCISSLTYCTL
ncbi:MAG: tyrosine-type recombinase/integrase [Patescibacteria group bacterium]|nr:tyrosine-type recombinase/integrase [Patescibacteria group bacterium]